VARRLPWAALALAPLTIVLEFAVHPGKVVLFVLAAASLVPLAWLIGEATEQTAEYTGARIGALLNASFGNAPEVIIALFAIADGLPNVVRGSLAGSIVSNLLLVLGAALIFGEEKRIDRKTLLLELALLGIAVLLLLIPSIPGWHGNPERHDVRILSIAPAAVLLVLYLVFTILGVRAVGRPTQEPREGSWRFPVALSLLAGATVLTAFVSETLVHSLKAFASSVGLSQFFISIVIVAIVGNAAEHGGAVVIARRGKMRLATEIAVSSSAQVGLLVVPVVMLLSLAFAHPLTLAFRPIELGAIGAGSVLAAAVAYDGCARRWEGAVLVCAYAAMVIAFGFTPDRAG
jgi:Ca2+:H+ antiporter